LFVVEGGEARASAAAGVSMQARAYAAAGVSSAERWLSKGEGLR